MDLQGTLGISKEVPMGFKAIRVQFEIDAPEATAQQLRGLQEKDGMYCLMLKNMPASAEDRNTMEAN